MDYGVPSADKVIEEGLESSGIQYGRYVAARSFDQAWKDMEVLDRRAVETVQEAIDFYVDLKNAIEKVLDNEGKYDFSDENVEIAEEPDNG